MKLANRNSVRSCACLSPCASAPLLFCDVPCRAGVRSPPLGVPLADRCVKGFGPCQALGGGFLCLGCISSVIRGWSMCWRNLMMTGG